MATCLDWGKVSAKGSAEGIDIGSLDISESAGRAFDFTRGWISWVLVVAVGLVALLTVMGKMPATKLPLAMLSLAGSAVAAVLMITLVISSPEGDGTSLMTGISIETSWTTGAWVATAAAIAATVGAFMEFTAGGGNLKDLTDANKWKGGPSA